MAFFRSDYNNTEFFRSEEIQNYLRVSARCKHPTLSNLGSLEESGGQDGNEGEGLHGGEALGSDVEVVVAGF